MTANPDTGMGPLGSEQGGLVVMVEVAHSNNLIFIKKYDIIIIQRLTQQNFTLEE